MSRRPFQLLGRYLTPTTPADLLAELEPTEQRIYLCRTVVCDRFLLRDVPGKHIDFLIESDDSPNRSKEYGWLVEIGDKTGKYDGAIRRRLTLRRYKPSLRLVQWRAIEIQRTDRQTTVMVGDHHGVYDRLRGDLDPERGGVREIVWWHVHRYYVHLRQWGHDSEIESLIGELDEDPATYLLSLSAANRLVSRRLYRLSRELGWRKCTLRERTKLGIPDWPQWIRISVLDDIYQRDGASEASHRAAELGDWGE